MAKKKQRSITDAELGVLKVLWEEGPLPARAITQRLYASCTESEVGTVHSLLARLERKGLVHRDRSLHVHLFSAMASRAEVAGEALQTLAVRMTDGSMAPFIIHLVESKRLTRDELTEIRRLLTQHPDS